MKTAPIVRLADTSDAVVLADLQEEIVLAMGRQPGDHAPWLRLRVRRTA
jgi:hypothetical protein